MSPLTLCDDLDGEAQDRFWVEASCTVEEAVALCVEEQEVRPTEDPTRVWLRPKDDQAESWERCEEDDSDGLEFYEFDLTDIAA